MAQCLDPVYRNMLQPTAIRRRGGRQGRAW